MHIFLTGEIQVGKSTVLDKTISLLGKKYGGFRTYFGEDRNSSNRVLYMNSADKTKVFNEENIVVLFRKGNAPIADVSKFNVYGSKLIKDARINADLILMDECGSLESEAIDFQNEIIHTLNGHKPVLGVVKLSSKGWTDKIRDHPNVKMITVTKENRNNLPMIISKYFKFKD